MANRILDINWSGMPGHFSRRQRAQVCYGTYRIGQIARFEKMKADLAAGKPIIKDRLALTEYLIINDIGVLRKAAEDPGNRDLGGFMAAIQSNEDITYSSSGRSIGMASPHNTSLFWGCHDKVGSMLQGGHRILEIGSGMTREAIHYAKTHPQNLVVAVEANAYNIRWSYDYLAECGLLKNPLPNFRLLFGDIRRMERPVDFRADLALAHWVFFHKDRPLKADKEMLEASLAWLNHRSTLYIDPAFNGSKLQEMIKEVAAKPWNSGKRVIFSGEEV